MKGIIVFLLFASGIAYGDIGGKYENGFSGSYYSYVNNKTYTFGITADQYNHQPRWPKENQSPPLSPRSAMVAAQKKLKELFTNLEEWHLKGVSLMPLELEPSNQMWIYIVEFEEYANSPLGRNGIHPHVEIPVIMNGEAITPVVENR